MTQAHEEGKETNERTNERTNGPSSPCLLRHPHTTAGLGREGPGPRRTSGGAPGLFLPARAEGEQPYIESCATLARGPIAPAFPAPPVYRSADGGEGMRGRRRRARATLWNSARLRALRRSTRASACCLSSPRAAPSEADRSHERGELYAQQAGLVSLTHERCRRPTGNASPTGGKRDPRGHASKIHGPIQWRDTGTTWRERGEGEVTDSPSLLSWPSCAPSKRRPRTWRRRLGRKQLADRQAERRAESGPSSAPMRCYARAMKRSRTHARTIAEGWTREERSAAWGPDNARGARMDGDNDI